MAALKYQFGNAEIKNYTYAVQGIGKTGAYLIDYLFEEKAKKVYFTDINEERIKALQTKYPQVVFVKPDDIYNLEVDVFVPCALGAILNEDTIPRLKAKIVAGTANNVLKDEIKDAQALKAKKILYAPDFVINAGGVINVYHELIGYNKDMVIADVKRIYDRLLEMFKIAEERNISTQEAANVFAEERIKKIHNIHRNFIPR
jgi:leucine dehydrogenase